MRSALVGVLFAASLSCGGNVVVDAKTTGGAGGSGGAAGTTSSTGTTGITGCQMGSCSASSDGSCSCDAVCGEQKILSVCSGSACECIENGILIAKCTGVGLNACDVFSGCCASAFSWE